MDVDVAQVDRKLGALIALMRSKHPVYRRDHPMLKVQFTNQHGNTLIEFTQTEITFAIGHTAFERMVEGVEKYEE